MVVKFSLLQELISGSSAIFWRTLRFVQEKISSERRSCDQTCCEMFSVSLLDPSSDHLKQIMAEHGGRYQHYYSRRSCTHIIATNLPDSKVKELK